MTVFLIDRYFTPLRTGNKIIAVALFIVVVLNLVGRVSRSSCNWVLSGLKIMLQCTWEDANGDVNKAHQELLDDFPVDLRSARNKFDLDPDIILYATCPRCCCTYAPTTEGGVAIYPARCDFIRFEGGQPCGAGMTRRKVEGGKSMRVPIRPFAYQKFSAFVAGLLSRPGIEDMIDRSWESQNKEWLTDIWDGSGVRELMGPDGKAFSDGPPGEGRLVWNLSVDWFNPLLNKAAGKSISTGSMVMSCANLPPSIRFRPENLYLVAIIPGPKEPSTDQMNHFLKPVVDDLLPAWANGIYFSRTYRHPEGRNVRSVLCGLVADMPARRKVAGANAGWLNAFASMLRQKDVNNIIDHVGLRPCRRSITYSSMAYIDLGS